MRIILQRDLNPKKGWVRGAVFDWPRPTITAISRQIGDDSWYKFSTELQNSMNRSAAVAEKRRGLGVKPIEVQEEELDSDETVEEEEEDVQGDEDEEDNEEDGEAEEDGEEVEGEEAEEDEEAEEEEAQPQPKSHRAKSPKPRGARAMREAFANRVKA